MVDRDAEEIFKKGSRTFSTSSLFFPRAVRDDVFTLYAFVRTGDDYVDSKPQMVDEFYRFRGDFRRCQSGEEIESGIIRNFAALARRRQFEPAWTEAYFNSMEMDLEKKTYATLEETELFMHGSAEVIGFMMARIMDLDEASFPYAALLGKSLQYINFIRDIDEDFKLGRNYFPAEDMRACKLDSLSFSHVSSRQKEFQTFISLQLERYRNWQEEAEQGYSYLPRRSLIPIKTASDMYAWTARIIAGDPCVVYRRKVKPRKARILARMLRNMIR